MAIIALNEADRIGRCLQSVAFADEVVVVIDSGSTDQTEAICRRMGAQVILQDWLGFTDQKNFALDQTTGDWILSLDADEAVSPELAVEIRAAVAAAPAETTAMSLPRLSRYLGRWIRHGGWYPDRKVRLCRRGRARWQGGSLHETLAADGRIDRLGQPLHHYVYRDLADQVATINRFSGLGAEERGTKGGGDVLWGLIHAGGKFAECYLWKLGLLDGLAGLVIAVNSAFYVFLRHAKSWEKTL